MRKGLLDLAVLNALMESERYGYELVKNLVHVPGLTVTEGTLYPLLSRLRLQGLVKTRLEPSESGPARKYYSLTPEGLRAARLMNEHLEELVKGCRSLRNGDPR